MISGIINFYFGACLASFISVIVQKDGLRWHRSCCLSCENPLTWSGLFPISSFIFQRGTCRHCKKPISHFLLFIEVVGRITSLKTDWYSKGDLVEPSPCLLLLTMAIFDYYYQETPFSTFLISLLVMIIRDLLFEQILTLITSILAISATIIALGILVLLKKFGLGNLFFYLIISFYYPEYLANLVFLFASLVVLTLYPKLKAQNQTHLSLPLLPSLFFSSGILKLLM